jgi:hypothetical protein
MSTFENDFKKYTEFAACLERELIARHGRAEAKRLFARMNRKEFQAFRKAAATDSLKRQWIARVLAGYPRAPGAKRKVA